MVGDFGRNAAKISFGLLSHMSAMARKNHPLSGRSRLVLTTGLTFSSDSSTSLTNRHCNGYVIVFSEP